MEQNTVACNYYTLINMSINNRHNTFRCKSVSEVSLYVRCTCIVNQTKCFCEHVGSKQQKQDEVYSLNW